MELIVVIYLNKQSKTSIKIIFRKKLDAVQTYLGPCSISAACNPSQNLVCNVTEQNNNQCLCLPYNYWNSTYKTCYAQRTYLESCASSTDCLSLTGLYCSSNACICKSNYYWSSAKHSCSRFISIICCINLSLL